MYLPLELPPAHADRPQQAQASIALDVVVAPPVLGAVGEEALFDTLAETVRVALGGGVLVRVAPGGRPFSERFRWQVEALQLELALSGQIAAPPQTPVFDWEWQRAAEATIAAEIARRSPLLPIAEGHVGIDISQAHFTTPARLFSERWASVRAGVSLAVHAGDPATQRQAIANDVVHALGLLSGLPPRPGPPTDAMTDLSRLAPDQLRVRGAAPVSFSADELALVLAALTR